VLLYPVAVQGAAAAPKIVAAIHRASARAECDVLILARGGGSLEDLWSFNEESVARAIAACSIPIISGIGHEVDFTIADFVADQRAPTPSGAAELAAPDCNEWLRHLATHSRRLSSALRRSLTNRSSQLASLQRRLGQRHPGIELRQRAQRLDELEQRLTRLLQQQLRHRRALVAQQAAHLRHASPVVRLSAVKGRLQMSRASLESAFRRQLQHLRSQLRVAAGTLDAISPLATLQRGYAIVTDAQGHVVTDAGGLATGQMIQARLASGRVQARVEHTFADPEE
jgi:exodeoxyribonuclease VII large subunit